MYYVTFIISLYAAFHSIVRNHSIKGLLNTLILFYIYDVNTVYTTCHAIALS